jgi:hypothetical protein
MATLYYCVRGKTQTSSWRPSGGGATCWSKAGLRSCTAEQDVIAIGPIWWHPHWGRYLPCKQYFLSGFQRTGPIQVHIIVNLYGAMTLSIIRTLLNAKTWLLKTRREFSSVLRLTSLKSKGWFLCEAYDNKIFLAFASMNRMCLVKT